MAGFSALAIFWLSFAAFIGPVFLIALVCSIRKAIRTRKEIIKRLQQPAEPPPPPESEQEATVISDSGVRRKPNIHFIEDEARKKEFRGATGSLVYGGTPKSRKMKDTDVDRQASDANKSNIAGREIIKPSRTDASSHGGSSSSNKNNHNNVGRTKHQHRNYYGNNIHGDALADGSVLYSNGVAGNVKNGRVCNGSRRRRSLGDEISSYMVPKSNGHIISEGTRYRGVSTLYKHDINHPGLKPDSYHNRSRRHSINSSSPTLERIPEVNCVEVELNTARSKSEDILIDHQTHSNCSPYLTTDGCGSDNKGFARSTETTIM